jgi:hypothetical protein
MRTHPLNLEARLLRQAGELLTEERDQEARTLLREELPWVYAPRKRPPGLVYTSELVPTIEGPSDEEWAEAVRLDRWCCCYCGRRIAHPRALELIARLVGPGLNDPLPHLSRRYSMRGIDERGRVVKGVQGICPTHPSIEKLVVEVEHVIPRTRIGSSNEPGVNLRAACTPCNNVKNNYLVSEFPGLVLRPRPRRGWSGLVDLITPLERRLSIAAAGEDLNLHGRHGPGPQD